MDPKIKDQIDGMESAFKKHLFKVAELEESLKSEKAMDELTDEERSAKRKELDEVKALMAELHQDLARLRSAQHPQVPWSFCIIFLVFFAYLMFKLWTNPIESFDTDDADSQDSSRSEHSEL